MSSRGACQVRTPLREHLLGRRASATYDLRRPAIAGLSARRTPEVVMSKSADKPKKQLKKKPQRTLKERRSEKRAAKKFGSGSLLRGDE